jgi:hypothetical protein
MPLTAVGIRGMAALAHPLCRGRLFTTATRIFACHAYLPGMRKEGSRFHERQQRRLRSVVGVGGKARR